MKPRNLKEFFENQPDDRGVWLEHLPPILFFPALVAMLIAFVLYYFLRYWVAEFLFVPIGKQDERYSAIFGDSDE